MSRSKWKGPFINYLYNNKLKNNNEKSFKVSRDSKIVPKFVGQVFSIHNGNTFSEITVTKEMIGHKFGEFSFTRSKFSFKKKKTKK